MVESLFKEFQEVCIDKLMATEGKELEITAYLNDPDQLDLVLEGYLYGSNGLNSKYVYGRNETYLRLSKSFNGKLQDGIVSIGKSPRFGGGPGSFFGGSDE